MLTHRLATAGDIPAIRNLMTLAINQLQQGFLDAATIHASHAVMGLDTQLITDGTYFVVETGGRLAGCGGWSRRATLFGGNHTASIRDNRLLDPARDPARVRAMYTHPDFVRRGVGRLILQLSETAAAAENFQRAELAATLAGAPLYRACGWHAITSFLSEPVEGRSIPLVRMGKTLPPGPAG